MTRELHIGYVINLLIYMYINNKNKYIQYSSYFIIAMIIISSNAEIYFE